MGGEPLGDGRALIRLPVDGGDGIDVGLERDGASELIDDEVIASEAVGIGGRGAASAGRR